MGVRTTAGTTLRISATVPATFNQAGYETIFDASPEPALIGEITGYGEFDAVDALVTNEAVDSAVVEKLKGNTNMGSMQLTISLDSEDAGQILLKAGRIARGNYSFKLTLPSGDVYYFQALVMGVPKNLGTVNQVTSMGVTLEINANRLNPGVIEVLAA